MLESKPERERERQREREMERKERITNDFSSETMSFMSRWQLFSMIYSKIPKK